MAFFKEFSFTSSTGKNRIYALICLPDCKPRAVIQIAHGIADHIDRYRDFMSFLADNGFVAVGNDHLGHGKSISNPDEKGFFAQTNGWSHVVDDMDKLRSIVQQQFSGLPHIFFGHSMGSFLTRTYIIDHPDNYHAAILSGTGHMLPPMVAAGYTLADTMVKLKGAKHISTLIDSIAFGSYNKCFAPTRTNFDWISSDEEQVDKYISDELCGFIACASTFRDMMGGIKYINDQSNINRMNKYRPIFLLSGADDPVGENGKGVHRAYKAFCKAGLQDIYMKLYPGGRHEMLNEINKAEVYNDIISWINSKI